MGGELESQVLKTPRHGSRTANSKAFVEAVRPKLAIFSVGSRGVAQGVLNRYDQSGADLARTDVDGAVIVNSDGRRLSYWTHLSGKSGTLP
ncbi:MAG: hypothetical protein GTO40_18585 [Deltaproteobacteria bacterium]|nr:hypothetical protein [Deltaproteobacteria bacterium]